MRRLLVVGLVSVSAAVPGTSASAVSPAAHHAPSTGATHIGPDKVAWYDTGRPTSATPPAPVVGGGPKDLVVAGFTFNTALLPVPLPVPPIRQVVDFVALSFTVPADASPASLTLNLTGRNTAAIDQHLPSGVTPIACPATSAFKSGLEQPDDAAPKYDCSKRSVVGQLTANGKSVTFPGISRLLLSGSRLSVVILPGSLGVERLVFSTPTPSTLSLLSFGSAPAVSSPPVSSPASPPPTRCDACGSQARPRPVIVRPSPPPVVTGLDSTAPTAPVIAAATPPRLAAATVARPDDRRERAAALAMLIALVASVGWLVVTERGSRVATTELGVGRFRASRAGQPPAI